MQIKSINGKSLLIAKPSDENPRSGAGSAVALKNDEVLMIYSRFTGGGADHDTAELFGGKLCLDTGKINDGRIFFPCPEAINQMCVSLERLQNGNIALVFLRKLAKNRDDVLFSQSSDEGLTWSDPIKVNTCCDDKYFVVNADRLRQFPSGRIAAPVAIYPEGKFDDQSYIGIFFSDNDGETWTLSERIKILDKNIAPPHLLKDEDRQFWEDSRRYPGRQQEPGTEALPDGRILLYCRTPLGYMYQAYSGDDGNTWSELKPVLDIVSPLSPQSIRKIPDRDRLFCVFNDRREVSFGDQEKQWNWRTPLSIAVSDDNAATWQVLGNIEDESHNYCYPSILFIGEKILLTYYESENSVEDGKPIRRNLASLKMQVLKLEDFLG